MFVQGLQTCNWSALISAICCAFNFFSFARQIKHWLLILFAKFFPLMIHAWALDLARVSATPRWFNPVSSVWAACMMRWAILLSFIKIGSLDTPKFCWSPLSPSLPCVTIIPSSFLGKRQSSLAEFFPKPGASRTVSSSFEDQCTDVQVSVKVEDQDLGIEEKVDRD